MGVFAEMLDPIVRSGGGKGVLVEVVLSGNDGHLSYAPNR